MGKSHLKRLNAPKTWPISRKSTKWITRPNLGSQPMHRTLSINTIMKEILCIVKTSKEIKTILNKGLVKVDGKVRKSINFPVCIMDVITIGDDNYRLLINTNGKLYLHPIKKLDATIKPNRVIGKKILRGNKLQINFFDGSNILSKDKKLRVHDTIVYENNKEKEYLRFEKGHIVYLIEGKQVGRVGIIKEIKQGEGVQPSKLVFKTKKEEHITLKDYAIVVGKTKSVIDIPNE